MKKKQKNKTIIVWKLGSEEKGWIPGPDIVEEFKKKWETALQSRNPIEVMFTHPFVSAIVVHIDDSHVDKVWVESIAPTHVQSLWKRVKEWFRSRKLKTVPEFEG